MVTALGITSLSCGGLAAILLIPQCWIGLFTIFIRILGMAGVVTGYLSRAALKERIPFMQQQAAAYGQPFRAPFDWGTLGLVVSIAALIAC